MYIVSIEIGNFFPKISIPGVTVTPTVMTVTPTVTLVILKFQGYFLISDGTN